MQFTCTVPIPLILRGGSYSSLLRFAIFSSYSFILCAAAFEETSSILKVRPYLYFNFVHRLNFTFVYEIAGKLHI